MTKIKPFAVKCRCEFEAEITKPARCIEHRCGPLKINESKSMKSTDILPKDGDRELLEMAAKAAGIQILEVTEPANVFIASAGCKGGVYWNPLTDDGDEARLEAALGLDVVWCFYTVKVGESTEYYDRHNSDKQAARRRAGVRAAAAIGAAK